MIFQFQKYLPLLFLPDIKVEPTEWNYYISMRMGVVYRTISQSLVSDGSLTFSVQITMWFLPPVAQLL